MSSKRIGNAARLAGREIRILLAEDLKATRELLLAAFNDAQYQIDIAVNGQEAVEKFRQSEYDLVLTDVQMPVMDGIDAARKMRSLESQDPARDRTPIIAITAAAQPANREACLAAGIDECLWKPVDLPGLFRKVLSVTQSPTDVTSGAAKQGATVSDRTPEPPPAFDLKRALNRLQGDQELFCSLVEFFNEDHAPLMASIKQGIEQNDAALVHRSAHSLKGLAANFDADAVVEAALEVERHGREERIDEAKEPFERLELLIEALLAELLPYCRAGGDA